MAVVDDPTHAITGLNAMTQRKRTRTGQSVKAFNPLSEEDQRIFKALLSGAHAMSGFRSAELREQLTDSGFLPLNLWFLGIYHVTQAKNSVSALELKRLLGVSYKAAWRLKHKLMQVMDEREADRVLGERVEVDDA